jgi:hypothetical protein
MSETQSQALIRLFRVAVSALIATGATALPEVLNAFVLDPVMRAAAMVALTGIIEALLKLLGGATEPLREGRGRRLTAEESPSWLSV